MNSKTILTLIILFIIINLGLFFLLSKDDFLKKGTQRLIETQEYPIFTNATVLPANPNQPSSSTLTYVFTGQVTKIEPIDSSSTRWILNNSDGITPEFLVTNETPIFKQEGGNLNKVSYESVQIGTNVSISMSYDLNSKTWTLNTITVTPIKQ